MGDIVQLRRALESARTRLKEVPVETPGGPPHDGGMDARVTLLEHLAAQTKTELQEIRSDMRDMRAEMRAGRAEDRTRFITLVITTITTGIAVLGVMFTMQANMLSAFQAGLSAVQAASAVSAPQQPAPQPIIIQIPPASTVPMGRSIE